MPGLGELEQRVQVARDRTARPRRCPAPRRTGRRRSSRRSCRSRRGRPRRTGRSSTGVAVDDADRHGARPCRRAAARAACPRRPGAPSARCSATYPPVIAAQRVPPSAWITSQSTQTVRSPRRVAVDDGAQRRGRSGAGSRPCGRRGARAWRRAPSAVERRAGQHPVLGGHPARRPGRASSPARTPRHAVQITRVRRRHQHGAGWPSG